MKVLFDHAQPFLLAHGGFQTQIEETKRGLENLDVVVEYVRWWDAEQRGDIIHFFGRPSGAYIDLAHGKQLRVVMSELLTGLGSRSARSVAIQRSIIHFARNVAPATYLAKMGWDAYAKADCIIALTDWEAQLMRRVFDAPGNRLATVPNGVADEFLTGKDPNLKRGKYLVCTATITERKRIVETARAAIQARAPVWIVGKPYSETDSYAQEFFALARKHPDVIRYEGAVQDLSQLARIYREARGFVLLSSQESLSLSALEAAACGCPLLLSDLPWARTVFKDHAVYCPIASASSTANVLHQFYDSAEHLLPPPKPLSWMQVGQELKKIYENVLRAS
jgi:glycosyltransferase involved in cell wall biosynthesis